jgi:hypothetical protein
MNGGGPNPPPLASCNVPGRLMRCCWPYRGHTDSRALRGYVARPKPRTALYGLLCGLDGGTTQEPSTFARCSIPQVSSCHSHTLNAHTDPVRRRTWRGLCVPDLSILAVGTANAGAELEPRSANRSIIPRKFTCSVLHLHGGAFVSARRAISNGMTTAAWLEEQGNKGRVGFVLDQKVDPFMCSSRLAPPQPKLGGAFVLRTSRVLVLS